MDGERNYRKIYKQLCDADYVKIRLHKGFGKGGEDYFSDEIYRKGEKRGNAWFVNGRWYSYRNLWPVFDGDYNEPEVRSRREKRSKYRLDKEIKRFLDEYSSDEDDDDDVDDNDAQPPAAAAAAAAEPAHVPDIFLRRGPGQRKAQEGRRLQASFDKFHDRRAIIARIRKIKDPDEAEDALEEYDEIEKIDDEEEKQARLEEFLEKLTRLGGSLFLCKRKRKNRKIKFLGAGKAMFKRKHFFHH